MFFVYFLFIMSAITAVRGIISAIKKKSIYDTLPAILQFPFFFCFFLGIISGGSAFNDARNSYELYQAGHYYLESHGNWTEVSYGRYLFVFISEIIGFSSLALCFILSIIHDRKNKRKPPQITKAD